MSNDRTAYDYEKFDKDNFIWLQIKDSLEDMIEGAQDDLASAPDMLIIGRYQGEIEGYKRVLDLPNVLGEAAKAEARGSADEISEMKEEDTNNG